MNVHTRSSGWRQSDRGAALPMVLIVFFVSVALVLAFLVSIVGSSQVTTANKSMVQAQAAAEAGIAAAQVEWANGPCSATTPLAITQPSADIERSCNAAGAKVTVTSTGYADDGTTAVVEAVFNLVADGGGDPPPADSESIVYAGAGSFTTYPGLTLQTLDGSPTQITIRKSAFDCNGITVPGDIIAGGNVHMRPCAVNGNVHIGGVLTTNSSSSNVITGELIAAGIGDPHVLSGTMHKNVHVNGRATLHNSGEIKGNLVIAGSGDSSIAGIVRGNATVAGNASVSGTVGGDLVVLGTGTTTITGTVTGNVIVAGNATVSGSVGNLTALGTGTSTITGTVTGNVIVGGNATLSGTVGSLTALGTGANTITGTIARDLTAAGTVKVDSGGRVTGNITAQGAGDLVIKSTVSGNITGNGAVKIDAWHLSLPGKIMARGKVSLIGGNNIGASLAGCVVGSVANNVEWNQPPNGVDVNAKKCQIAASSLTFPTLVAPTLPSAPTSAAAPSVPDWRPYTFAPADWTGFDYVKVEGAACTRWTTPWQEGGGWASDWNRLQSVAKNTVFDLSTCGTISTNNGNIRKTQQLSYDVALIVNQANLNGLTVSAATGKNPKLWFITPGAAENGAPKCTTTSPSVIFESTKMLDPVKTMVYTPCSVRVSNGEFTGNLYAGTVDIGGNPKITFASMGIPGWASAIIDPDDPPIGPVNPATAVLGTLVSQRNTAQVP